MEDRIVQLLQTQMNNERQNAQNYFAIASMCENMAYDGFAKFFRKQAGEEQTHAQKFCEFLISKRIPPTYTALQSVVNSIDLKEITTRVANLEVTTTENLKMIYELAGEDDPQVCALLDWFLLEQVEEETWSRDLADLVGRTDATGWIILDERYGER